MKSTRNTSMNLMHVICLLPLIVFFGLVLAGIQLNPFWVPVVMILCCLAMFFLSSGTCNHERSELTPESTPEEPPRTTIEAIKIDDVFRVHQTRQMGGTLVHEGDLLRDPEETYAVLKERTKNTDVTPLLLEDQARRPILAFMRMLMDPTSGKKSRPWINFLLLLLTFVTTTWAGALHAGVDLLQEPGKFLVGIPYSLTLLLILGTHELGHYFVARAYKMRVTLPYFIPVPFGVGTFGAFIELKSPAENRRALFDVGVAGPLAGLVFAIPALWIGLQYSHVLAPEEPARHMHGGLGIGSSVLMTLMAKFTLGDALNQGHHLLLHPLAFAGWLGLLVTALNLLPIGQLDGGHIADAMFGRVRGAAIGMVAFFALLVLGFFVWSGLLTWAFIVYLIAGGKGMPPLNDVTRLGAGRMAVGTFAFVVLLLILMPVPHHFYDMLGIRCPYL